MHREFDKIFLTFCIYCCQPNIGLYKIVLNVETKESIKTVIAYIYIYMSE